MNQHGGRLRILSVQGVPIYVHFSWVVIFALITWSLATGYFPAQDPDLPETTYWVKGLVASLLFFVSILLHELGHALVALRRGVEIGSITLFIFGGVAHMKKDPQDGRTELMIAAAGPVVSLGLAAVFAVLASLPPIGDAARAVARYLALINFVVALFNLVPAFPLDGGRLLRGLLWNRLGKSKATRVAARAGSFFALFLILTGAMQILGGAAIGGIWYVLIGWFLKEASAGAYQGARMEDVLAGVTVRDAMLSEVALVPAHISLSEAAHDYFLRTGYGGYPVVRNDQVVGLLCLKDVLQVDAAERDATSVQGAMTPLSRDIVVAPDVALSEAMAQMARVGVGRLLVMDGPRLVGFLPTTAVVRHLRIREQLGDS